MKNISLLLLAGSALLLASCDRTPRPSDLNAVAGTLKEPTFSETTLTFGTQAWTGGAGSLIAEDFAGKELARAALAADGNFNLTLPQTVAADRLSPLDVADLNSAQGCTGNVTSSAQANGTALDFRVDANKDGSVAPASLRVNKDSKGDPTGLSVTAGVLVYVDRAVTIKGSQTCTVEGKSVRLDVDWQLKQGWNKTSTTLAFNISSAGVTAGSISLSSGGFPNDWLYLEDTDVASPLGVAGLSSQSLKAPQFQFPFFH